MSAIHSKLTSYVFILFITVFIAGCGGSSGGSAASNTLNGTAATGAAIVGTINVYGASGGQIIGVAIDANGGYSVDVSGLTAPYFLEAVPTNSSLDVQYSFATSTGTVNITPLSTLLLFNAIGQQDPSVLAASWPAMASSVLANADDAQAVINANFIGLFPLQSIDFSTYDFLTTDFAIGDDFDQVLDLVTVSVSSTSVSVMITGNVVFSFDANIDFSMVDIGGTTGGGNSGAATGTLTITGPGTSELSVQNQTFTANAVEVQNSTITWRSSGISVFAAIVGQSNDVVSLIFTTQGQSITVVQWINLNLVSNITGVSYDGQTITFNNAVLSPSTNNVGDIMISGSLTVN